ncbi:MAG: pyridoxal 5'-phosphate synthase glutaminase subunit PdxT [Polyangiaceae bacterium]|nr:pyridoxal 5'-phosphate synthase glutaminase subunit PdxT [Polyangiaceae bacterium]
MAKIGILALQGGIAAHARAAAEVGAEPVLVRSAEAFDALDALILPGGESTTILKLLERHALTEPLDGYVRSGRPVLATCAGLILAAAHVTRPAQKSFGWLPISVARNAWGRQVDSFEATDDAGEQALIFIRAPRIVEVSRGASVLSTFRGEPVAVRAGAVTGLTFHPELGADRRYHAALLARS